MDKREKEVDKFIKSQLTFTARGPEYIKTERALKDVLLKLPERDYNQVTKNLILSVLHKRALGQLMHMKPVKGKFTIMQLVIPKNISMDSLRYVIAHELGHVMQGRNWKKSDGMKLETFADNCAKKWGFPRTNWINKR